MIEQFKKKQKEKKRCAGGAGRNCPEIAVGLS